MASPVSMKKTQKVKGIRRMASSILGCGSNKIWIDPTEKVTISRAKSREDIRKLLSDNLIMRRPDKIHSRYHARIRDAQKAKGRHMGLGKRRGTANARDPVKKKWILKIRQLRTTLKDMERNGKITKLEHRLFRQQAKGNLFKNNRIMIETIEKKKSNEKRMMNLTQQVDAITMGRS